MTIGSARKRAEIIAGIRALARFLENHPELPCPNSVSAQHSTLDVLDPNTFTRTPVPDAEQIETVHAAADLLGVDPRILDTGTGISAVFKVASGVRYVVYGELHDNITTDAGGTQ